MQKSMQGSNDIKVKNIQSPLPASFLDIGSSIAHTVHCATLHKRVYPL